MDDLRVRQSVKVIDQIEKGKQSRERYDRKSELWKRQKHLESCINLDVPSPKMAD